MDNMANFLESYGIKPKMTSDLSDKKPINLFDFSNIKKPSEIVQQNKPMAQPTKVVPTIQPTKQEIGSEDVKIFRDLLSKGIEPERARDLILKSKGVQEQPKPESKIGTLQKVLFPAQAIIGKGLETDFGRGAIDKTKESFTGGLERIQEAGVGMAEGKYNFMESAVRGGAGALQSAFSPLSGIIGETIESGIEKIPEDIRTRIKQEAEPTIEGLKEWYNNQPADQQRRLQNIGVTTELLANFLGVKGIQKATPTIKQGLETTGDILKQGGDKLVDTGKVVLQKTGDIPKTIRQGVEATSDLIDTGVEKTATKILGSSDGTKELFKATSPSYNTLSKNKDITRIVENAKKADETIVKYGYKPTNTTERVKAYNDTMKKVWADIEKARGGVDTKVDAGDIAKIIDDEVSKLSVGGVINPAIKKDVDALLKQSDYFKQIGKVDIPTLGNQRTLLNAITDWGQTTEYGNTFSNIMKKVNFQIKQIEDDILTKAGKGLTGNKLKEYGALRNMYDDIVKQDIKALRAKGMAIDESFGRIAGISEAIGGVAQLFTNPKQALPTMLSGGSKLLLGKTAGKLKDTDFLIKTGYEKLSKNLKPNLLKNVNNVDNNISSTIKYSKKPTKVSGQTQVKPTKLKESKPLPQTTALKKLVPQIETKLKNLTKDNIEDVAKSFTNDAQKLAKIKVVIRKYLENKTSKSDLIEKIQNILTK